MIDGQSFTIIVRSPRQKVFEICCREWNSTIFSWITHFIQFLEHFYSEGRLLIDTKIRCASISNYKIILFFFHFVRKNILYISTIVLSVLIFHSRGYFGATAIKNSNDVRSFDISKGAELILEWVDCLTKFGTFVTNCQSCSSHDTVAAIVNPHESLRVSLCPFRYIIVGHQGSFY